jgi:hypothetical protein
MRRQYGLNPWDLSRYTARELNALGRDVENLRKAEEARLHGDT